jgi:hypothetical protein
MNDIAIYPLSLSMHPGYPRAFVVFTKNSVVGAFDPCSCLLPSRGKMLCNGLFDGVAALYFSDNFSLSQTSAGLWVGIFGFMNLFVRAFK